MKLNSKKLVVIGVLLLVSVNSYSQKCIVENDAITGERTCKFSNKQKTLRYEYDFGDVVDLYMTFIYGGEQNATIPAGSEVFIKLKNDTIINIKSRVDATPQTQIVQSQTTATVYSRYTLAFELTPNQVRNLASSKIAFMRYPSLDGGSLDIDIKGFGKIYVKKITKGAQCMMANLK